MTLDEVREATGEAVAAAEHLSAHLTRFRVRVEPLFPLDPTTIAGWQDEDHERLHALLRMFDQLYDLTGRKLIRGLLLLSGETVAGLSAQNQFRRAEALGALADAERWIEVGATRNMLAHDYPTNLTAVAERANRAWRDLPALLDEARSCLAYVQTQGLLA